MISLVSLIIFLENTSPFQSLENFLKNDVVKGLLSLVTPLAVISIIIAACGMYVSHEEHTREKFKKALIATVIITAIAFMAETIIGWLDTKFN